MLLNSNTQNLGLITYVVITIVLFVVWGLIWKWHHKTKAEIDLTRTNLYRRWDDEDEMMNLTLEPVEKETIESTKIIK